MNKNTNSVLHTSSPEDDFDFAWCHGFHVIQESECCKYKYYRYSICRI